MVATTVAPRSDSAIRALLARPRGSARGTPSGSTTSSARDSQRVGSRLEAVGGAPGVGRHAHGGGFEIDLSASAAVQLGLRKRLVPMR